MKLVSIVIFTGMVFSTYCSFGQEDKEEKNWLLYGYVKDMVSVNLPELSDSALVDNLIHNRLNFSWFPNDKFKTQIELRTRFFYGDLVQLTPNYADFIDQNNDYFDLSVTPVDREKLVLHSMIDRAYAEWREENWTLTIGRQRINWGLTLVWNPNDVFNAYNFFDFDYEERPGSDAIRFQKYIGYAGGFEIAVSASDSFDELTAAGLYKWNVGNYDMQVMGGVMKNTAVLGGGWAGSLGMTGFKGELTYFHGMEDFIPNELMATISMDYSFVNSLYLNGSVLYKSRELNSNLNPFIGQGVGGNLDVRSISPYNWSAFVQSSYQINPLLNGGLSMMYFPGERGVFFNPFLTLSVIQNLDVDLLGQFFINAEPQNVSILYLRLKYSF